MRRRQSVLAGAAGLIAILLLSGCAEPARVGSMVVPLQGAPVDAGAPLYQSIAIENVYGGQETSPLWTSQVDNAGFKDALNGSLRARGIVGGIPANARYSLVANLQQMDQPLFGASFTVTSTVQYILTRLSDRAPILDETIAAPYTAAFGDSLLGVERLRLANEGSIRENIRRFIQVLEQRIGLTAPPATPPGA
jgi:hypothetical protein